MGQHIFVEEEIPGGRPAVLGEDERGGIGHNLPQEAPQAFAQAVIDVDGF